MTGHVTDVVSIVGDVGGTYKSDSPRAVSASKRDLKIHTFQGGVKFRVPTMNPNVVAVRAGSGWSGQVKR